VSNPSPLMKTRMLHRSAAVLARRLTLAASLCGVAALAACDPNEVLDVVDPDIIAPEQVNDSAGAEALRVGALARFNGATTGVSASVGGNEGLFILGGTLADELRSSDTFVQRDETDARGITLSNGNLTQAIRDAQRARLSAAQATRALVKYAPSRRAQAAEMLFQQAYMETLMAESLCSGIPFSDFVDGVEQIGAPNTTEQALQRAVAHADSATSFANGTDALSVSVRNAAAITKGRALLDLGRFADAAAAVANVATSYQLVNEQSQTTRDNAAWSWINNQRRFTVVDREGGNGLPFISAADPRLPVAARVANGGFDSTVDLYRQNVYPTRETSFPLITGIEARLIEAEAALQANNTTLFLSKLNDPRSASRALGAVTVTPAQLPALTDPGSQAARVDLLFRERGFWMYLTGHRLGDLRRLVRQYGRPAESVYPTGAWGGGTGNYGTDVNLPVTQAEENNPQFTGCIDRRA
jgi:hypothetical protein